MLRTSLAACHQLAPSPHYLCLPFLLPAHTMSRRSSRLSGHLSGSSPPSSLEVFHSNRTLSTDAAAGPSSRADATSIPYFEEWPTEALQAEVKRYGFKVSRKRATLIDQLKAVYEALHRSKAAFEAPTGNGDAAAAATEAAPVARTKRTLILPASTSGMESAAVGKGKGKGKGRQSDPFVLDADSTSDSSSDSVTLASNGANEEAGDYTAQLELEAQSATDGSSSDIPLSAHPPEGDAPEPAVEPTAALADTMTSAIRADAALWGRVLRFEPVSFDEFVSIATQSGLGMDTGKRKDEVRTWLDRQCICFYSNDLTGPRSRH